MSKQIFANFTDQGQHGAGDLQSKSQAGVVSSGSPTIDIVWDAAYPDTNYGVVLGLETPLGDENAVTLAGFSKTATGIHVYLTVPGGSIPVTVHALAFKY